MNNRQTKIKVWHVFHWIDNKINHGILEEIFDWKIFDNKFGYTLWKLMVNNFCQFVNIYLVDVWFLEDYVYSINGNYVEEWESLLKSQEEDNEWF